MKKGHSKSVRAVRALLAASVVLVPAGVGACGSDDSPFGDGTCTPGSTQPCLGPGQCQGAQSCAADGKSFLACDCGGGVGGAGGSSGASGAAATGGSAGSGQGGTAGSAGNAGTSGSGGSSAGGGGPGGTAGAGGAAGAGAGGTGGVSGTGGTPDASAGAGGTGGSGGSPDAGVDASPDADDGGTCEQLIAPDSGGPISPPSCSTTGPGTGSNCGYLSNDYCCASPPVPCGTFNRGNDAKYPATITTSFRLDRYEVTIGRFRKFVEAGGGIQANAPPSGAGAHPKIGIASGWNAAWNSLLANDTPQLVQSLKCSVESEWTDTPGANENRPVSCVDWYTSFAFCIWDQARLPTEAEWNYAAAGGSLQRPYASISFPSNPSNTFVCNAPDPQNVGSKQYSYQLWWQYDLSGNIEEWTFDRYNTYPVPCVDCASLTNSPAFNGMRVIRGGAYSSCLNVKTTDRSAMTQSNRTAEVGFRCAREL